MTPLQRAAEARRIANAIVRLERLHTPEAESCANALWSDLADTALGSPWHGAGPIGDLSHAEQLLQVRAA